MTCLIDTHTFLWFVEKDPRLSERANNLIESDSNRILIHFASFWEIAIKINIGKLVLNRTLHEYMKEAKRLKIGFANLDEPSILSLTNLPMHHRDPFDRILIACCLVEKMPILSADRQFDAYEITRIW